MLNCDVLLAVALASSGCRITSRAFFSGAYLAITIVIFAGGVAIVLSPRIDAMIDPWYVLPDLPIELAVGLWLAIRGANIPATAGSQPMLNVRTPTRS